MPIEIIVRKSSWLSIKGDTRETGYIFCNSAVNIINPLTAMLPIDFRIQYRNDIDKFLFVNVKLRLF